MSQEEIRKEKQQIADDLDKAINKFKTATQAYDEALADSNRRTNELQTKCKHKHINASPRYLECPDCGKRDKWD